MFCVNMLFTIKQFSVILSSGKTSAGLADVCSRFKLAAFAPKIGGCTGIPFEIPVVFVWYFSWSANYWTKTFHYKSGLRFVDKEPGM